MIKSLKKFRTLLREMLAGYRVTVIWFNRGKGKMMHKIHKAGSMEEAMRWMSLYPHNWGYIYITKHGKDVASRKPVYPPT